MLFNVQDSDRPMFVVAADWNEALLKWQKLIAEENPGDYDGPDNACSPQGIQMIADDHEIIL